MDILDIDENCAKCDTQLQGDLGCENIRKIYQLNDLEIAILNMISGLNKRLEFTIASESMFCSPCKEFLTTSLNKIWDLLYTYEEVENFRFFLMESKDGQANFERKPRVTELILEHLELQRQRKNTANCKDSVEGKNDSPQSVNPNGESGDGFPTAANKFEGVQGLNLKKQNTAGAGRSTIKSVKLKCKIRNGVLYAEVVIANDDGCPMSSSEDVETEKRVKVRHIKKNRKEYTTGKLSKKVKPQDKKDSVQHL